MVCLLARSSDIVLWQCGWHESVMNSVFSWLAWLALYTVSQ